jgi:hypothetical protein
MQTVQQDTCDSTTCARGWQVTASLNHESTKTKESNEETSRRSILDSHARSESFLRFFSPFALSSQKTPAWRCAACHSKVAGFRFYGGETAVQQG